MTRSRGSWEEEGIVGGVVGGGGTVGGGGVVGGGGEEGGQQKGCREGERVRVI